MNQFDETTKVEEARIAKKKAEAFACKRCPEKYSNNTKLHDHVREKHNKKPVKSTPPTPPFSLPPATITMAALPTPPASPPPASSTPVSPVSPPHTTIALTTPSTPSSPPPPASIEPAASSKPITSPIIPPTTPRKPIS